MKRIQLLLIAVLAALSLTPCEIAAQDFTVSGYVLRRRASMPKDLSFLQHVDRVEAFVVLPDEDGVLIPNSSFIKNAAKLQSQMSQGQELFLSVGRTSGTSARNMEVMFSNAKKRKAFVRDLVTCIDKTKAVGIGICWYQTTPASVTEDSKKQLSAFVEELKDAMPSLKLSLTLNPRMVDLAVWAKDLVDDVTILSFSSVASNGELEPMSMFRSRLKEFSDAGFPNDRLIVGVPFYGRDDLKKTTLNYDQIVAAKTDMTSAENWYGDYSYNGADLIKMKTQYLKQNGYKGIFVSEFTQDVPYSNPLSLLRAITGE